MSRYNCESQAVFFSKVLIFIKNKIGCMRNVRGVYFYIQQKELIETKNTRNY